MQPETWVRIRAVFERALEVEPAEREAFLAAACGGTPDVLAEVRAMLAADSDGDHKTSLLEAEPGAILAADLTGANVGGYEVVRRIGAGGMGTVYEARQQRPQRTVALKALAAGFPSARARRRFEDEAEILARLRHPAIAQVLAAGSARIGGADVPWFAMEMVEEPRTIDRFVRERGLDARAIAALFTTVCEAVHYAHQRGVIHRDLKPGNVLVDRQGQVKVIDFGIARLTDRDALARYTRTGEILGTLAYMSPERLEGGDADDDTAADVYALGVMLYELLAGSAPFQLDSLPPVRAMELLRAADPPPLARKNTAVPHELEWITAKAMAREPSRRYASAAELARELVRFAKHEPLAAGPPSTAYRLRKLAWRHRLLLGVAAAAFVAVSVGLVIALLGWRRVAQAEQLATRKAAVLTEVNRFQQDILKGAYGSAKGRDVRLADVVDEAAAALAQRRFTDPIIEINARNSIGISYLGLGRLAEAEQQFLRARALLDEHGFDLHSGWDMPVRSNLAQVYDDLGKLELAEREFRTVLADNLAVYGPEHNDVAVAQSNLAHMLIKRAAFAEALPLVTQMRTSFERTHGAQSVEAINARGMLAQVLAGLGRAQEAERAYAEVWTQATQHLEPDHPARLGLLNGYAGFLYKCKRFADQVPLAEELAAARERTGGPTHPATLNAWSNLAAGQAELGRLADAEATLRRVTAAWEQLDVRAGFDYIVNQQNLTVVIRRQGRTAEAEALARAQRVNAAKSLPKDHWLLGVVTKEHGACLRELGRHAEAEPLLLEAHALLARVVGANDQRTQKVVTELVALYEAWQRPQDATVWRTRLAPAK
jgi:tetratricopeptide (TPR) repeat protein